MENLYVKSLKSYIVYAKNQADGIHRVAVDKICKEDEINKKIYSNIRGLFYFILRHKELSSEFIEKIIKENKSTFKILNHFISRHDNAIEELRTHGSRDVIDKYIASLRSNINIKEDLSIKLS